MTVPVLRLAIPILLINLWQPVSGQTSVSVELEMGWQSTPLYMEAA